MCKRLIPAFLRIRLRLTLILLRDWLSGRRFQFAERSRVGRAGGRDFEPRITIRQRINPSEWAENKKHNLSLGFSRFQDRPLLPGRIFSFWHQVGNPSRRNGYRMGINIIAGRLDFDFGGGLCQLSGLIYHLALCAGLEIIERFPHSVDLYTDSTRYTPLGADATTAYGYKDLRIRNNLETPICFRVRIKGESLIGSLCAPQPVPEYTLRFEKTVRGGREFVETLRRGDSGRFQRICSQSYLISEHDRKI